jgi:tRNA(adenine34) deaminase
LKEEETVEIHNFFMKKALIEAQKAYDLGEIPVGAIIVANQKIIAKAHNLTEQLVDVSAHAEIIAISAASHFLQAKYLPDCTLYVTLEPCVMCAGAIFWSQIGKVVFGAFDEHRGFLRLQTEQNTVLHPKTSFIGGILEEDCQALLKSFFSKIRKK